MKMTCLSRSFSLFVPAVILLGTWCLPAQTGVRLNEVLANCVRGTNQEGKVITWIELVNTAPSVVDLSDASLTDSAMQPRKYVIPRATILPPMGFLVVNCGPTNWMGAGPVTGFCLRPCQGGSVFLYSSGGALLDSMSYGIQAADFSLGRFPNGTGAWVLNQPTPGAINLPAELGSPTNLKINEWMAANRTSIRDPMDGSNDDWIELYNPGTLPVALGSLGLSDDLSNLRKFVVPSLSFIGVGASGGYTVFYADGNLQGADHVNFKLNAAGESIALTQADGATIIDSVTTCMPPSDIAEGRLPDGSTNIILFLPQTRGLTASPGAPNPFPSILGIDQTLTQQVVRLQFTVQSNLNCTVQYQEGLAGTWIDLTNIAAAPMEREVEVVDLKTATGQRFYRITR